MYVCVCMYIDLAAFCFASIFMAIIFTQAISLSTTEGQRVSRGIPFRNAGNISLDIQLQVSTLTDLFSVVPERVKLSPGQVFGHFSSRI